MIFSIPFGRRQLSLNLPDELPVEIIEPASVTPAAEPLEEVRTALTNPVGAFRFSDFSRASSVAIAISDKTRPVPNHHLLPPLLEQLKALGIPNKAITLYIAVGTHPPMQPDEFSSILPDDILCRYRVVSHNATDLDSLVFLGHTPLGTPVWVNKEFTHSTLKIVVGNIEPHQFAGFSGGVKSAAIGLVGFETITHNHALMTHPDAQIGAYETNPTRQDIEEIGKIIGIHLALNAILNQSKQIVHVLAGEPVSVMRAGIPLSRQVCQVGVQDEFDIIISSPGGHPKDINLYQAQKGLAHAALITKTGGAVLLAAACPDGSGSPHYEKWMVGKSSYSQVLESFSAEGFRIGPHKAYQFARDASRVKLLFFSDMDPNISGALLLNPVDNFEAAVQAVLAAMPPGGRIGIMPHASSTIPYLNKIKP